MFLVEKTCLRFCPYKVVNNLFIILLSKSTRHLKQRQVNGKLDWLKSMMNKLFTIVLWTKSQTCFIYQEHMDDEKCLSIYNGISLRWEWSKKGQFSEQID